MSTNISKPIRIVPPQLAEDIIAGVPPSEICDRHSIDRRELAAVRRVMIRRGDPVPRLRRSWPDGLIESVRRGDQTRDISTTFCVPEQAIHSLRQRLRKDGLTAPKPIRIGKWDALARAAIAAGESAAAFAALHNITRQRAWTIFRKIKFDAKVN